MEVRHFTVYKACRVTIMARKLAMTWIPAQRRWIKKHRGKMYAVSCRQLGCAETKDASAAANAWWESRFREIEAAPPTEEELKANAFKVWSMVQDWKQLSEEDREQLVDSLVGEGQYRKDQGPGRGDRRRLAEGHTARSYNCRPGRSMEEPVAVCLPVRPAERRPLRRLLPQHEGIRRLDRPPGFHRNH